MDDAVQGNDLPQDPMWDAANAAANADGDDDFLAAFNNATGDEPDTEATTTSGTADAPAAAAAPAGELDGDTDDEDLEEDTGTAPASPAPAAEDDLDAPVVITRRQLAELSNTGAMLANVQNELRQLGEKTNGRFGSIQQTLKEVREQASKGIRPSFDQLEAMEDAFPELAEVMKRDLTRIFGAGNETQQDEDDPTASGASAPGAAALDPLDTVEVRAILREKNLAIVDATHKGWRQLPHTEDWKAWQQQLPSEAQQLLASTSDSTTLNEALDDFKDWQQKRAAATSASNQRGKRLEHAIPATTGSATAHRAAPSDDDEFAAGFQSVAGRR